LPRADAGHTLWIPIGGYVVNRRMAHKDTELLGQKLLHYQIVEKIGEGRIQ